MRHFVAFSGQRRTFYKISTRPMDNLVGRRHVTTGASIVIMGHSYSRSYVDQSTTPCRDVQLSGGGEDRRHNHGTDVDLHERV